MIYPESGSEQELTLGFPDSLLLHGHLSLLASAKALCTVSRQQPDLMDQSCPEQHAFSDVMSELTVFGKTIDGGLVDTNIKFRALVWIGAEILLWSAVAINFINRAWSVTLADPITFILTPFTCIQPRLFDGFSSSLLESCSPTGSSRSSGYLSVFPRPTAFKMQVSSLNITTGLVHLLVGIGFCPSFSHPVS